MYERFTDRARKVIQLARDESRRLNHKCVGTEHILLGLLKANPGVGVTALKKLGVDLDSVRLRVASTMQRDKSVESEHRLIQSLREERVIEYAWEEARNLNHNYVGTEHLLLASLREAEGVPSQVLREFAVSLETVRVETLNVIKDGI
jgi:ATP-dependent Clp protease ATP-binding subunit ClpC